MNSFLPNENIKTEESKIPSIEKINIDSDYIQSSIEAYNFLKIKDYNNAKDSYKKCIKIAKAMGDEIKQCESMANLGITLFFCGKILESSEMLQNADRLCLCVNTNGECNHLSIKIASNLSLTLLASDKIKESINYVNQIIELIRSIKDVNLQLTFLKTLLDIFFRIDSLIENNLLNKNIFDLNEKIVLTNDYKDMEENHQKIVNKILYFFHKFLRENDFDSWIQCLNDESENFKFMKDYNGFIFCAFNQYVSLYAKNVNNLPQVKPKIMNLCKILTGDKEKFMGEEKPAEQILQDMKEKIEASVTIYNKIYELEEEIKFKIQQYKNHIANSELLAKSKSKSNKIFIRIFLKYALNYIDSINKNNSDDNINLFQMKNQIDLTLKLIEKDELDLSNVQILNIDPDINNSLRILFENLLFIKYKFSLSKTFKHYMYQTLGYKSREDLLYIKERKFNTFLVKNFQIICEGDILTKINFSSSGKKEHFYKLIPEENIIRVYQKKTDKNFKTINFSEVKKFGYGVNSENLRKRFKNMKYTSLKNPWQFFSIITIDRSVDLYLEETKLNQWFYGIYYHLKKNESTRKIISVNNFLITKLKLKLMNNLKEHYELNRKIENNNPYKELINNLLQGKYIFYFIAYLDKGIQNFSFAKIFLLYLKAMKINLK